MKQFTIVAMSLVIVLFAGASIVQAQDITVEGREQDRLDRIEVYKQEVSDRLSDAEQRRVAGVCKAAQTIVERLQSNMDTVTENRQRIYGVLGDKLTLLSDQLDAAAIDTTLLDTYIGQMQVDAQEIVTSLTEHQQILADLAIMDCGSDINGFQATLSVARTTRSELKTTTTSLKAYVQETIKPEIQSLRQQLADAKSEGGQ